MVDGDGGFLMALFLFFIFIFYECRRVYTRGPDFPDRSFVCISEHSMGCDRTFLPLDSSLFALIICPIMLQRVRAYFVLIYSVHLRLGTSEPLFSALISPLNNQLMQT